MEINWFTFGAQIVNFLLLVFLLRWFLYRPIVEAMQRRQERIENRLNDAEEERTQAEQLKLELQKKHRELDEQRDDLLDEIKHDVEQRRKDLLDQARQDIEHQQKQWKRSLQQKQSELINAIRARSASQALQATRKALEQLANQQLEKQVIEQFLQQIDQLPAQQQERVSQLVRDNSHTPMIRSAFPISDPLQHQLRKRISDAFEIDSPIEFREEPSLLCGIELIVGDHEIGWNASEFLDDLEEELAAVLAQHAPNESLDVDRVAQDEDGEKQQGEPNK